MDKGCGIQEKCWVCENTRELTEGDINKIWEGPWICDECKRAILWAKGKMKKGDPFRLVMSRIEERRG